MKKDRFSGAQKVWLREYQSTTGFEPLFQNEGFTFNEVARKNLKWYEEHINECYAYVSSHVPYDEEVE